MSDKKEHTEILKKIDAYVKGNLTETETEQLWIQLAKHPEMLDVLKTEVALKKMFNEQKASSKKSFFANLPRWSWHAAAAAAVILVALIQFFRIDPPTTIEQFTVAEIPAAQLETSNGVRSKDLSISEPDSLLNIGFKLAVSGQTADAMGVYNRVVDMNPGNMYLAMAYFNIGVLHYNQERYLTAEEALNVVPAYAKEHPMLKEKAWWYLANAYVKQGKFDEARNAADSAYSMDGIFREKAFLLLRKLDFELGNPPHNEAPYNVRQ